MIEESRENVAKSYDFSQFEKIVEFVKNEDIISPFILKLYPRLKVLLAVSPDISEKTKKNKEIKNRCEITTVNFPQTIPPGSLLYLVYNFFHQINEELKIKFLENFSKSTEVYTRLLIIDKIEDEKYYNELLKKTGFIMTNVIRTKTEFTIIEALRK